MTTPVATQGIVPPHMESTGCAGRCSLCIRSLLETFAVPGGYWYTLITERRPQCWRCRLFDCGAARSHREQCTTPAGMERQRELRGVRNEVSMHPYPITRPVDR